MTDTISLNVETNAELPKITELVVFGDSLSDIGNIYQATNQETPPSPPNFEGRFSNGPIWVDQILPELGLTSNSLLNFAYGGAETGVNTVTQGIPGLTEQVALFEASLNSNPVDPNALYTILIGGNDLTNSPSEDTIATAITNISTAITDLANLGAENIVILNLPDLGLLPKNIEAGTSTIATGLATAFNTELNTSLTTLETTLNLDLHLVDLFGLTQAIGANPNDYGFTQPINDVLIDENLATVDPTKYVFWDELHPTTKTHGLITDTVITTMENDGILAVVGQTDVILNGVTEDVRTEETNLGNLIADANLSNSQVIDSTVDIALVNGGAIGSNINIGEITNFEVEAVSPFNNDLVLLTLTGTELEQIIEHSVAQYGNMDIGPFPQISGLSFSFDPDQQAIAFNTDGTVATDGQRVQSLVVNDSEGHLIKLVENGELVAENANTEFRVVTLSFLAEGGDDYPFDIFGDNPVPLDLTEQASLTTYLQKNYLDTPFKIADTAIENDQRSQNLNFRSDTVIPDNSSISGQVWEDNNGDGSKNNGEPLLDGIKIELLDFEGTVIQTTTTKNGLYSFENLAAGPYVVKADLESNFQQTFPGVVTTFDRGPVNGKWDYDDDNTDGSVGPNDWGQVAPDADGFFQSPIDLTVPAVDLSKVLSFNYSNDDTTELIDKGFNVEVEYPEANGNTINYLGEKFELVQFHLHYQSEHEVNGQLDDMELHLVHRHEDGGLSVVGFLIKEGATNEVLAPVFETINTFLATDTPDIDPPTEIESKIDLNSLIPDDKMGWYYQGSLTTPPASEGVNWFVFEKPLELSSEQIDIFQEYLASIGNETNNRPVLDLNGRQVNELNHEVTLGEGEVAANLDFGVQVENLNQFGGLGDDNLDAADPETGFSGNKTLTFTGSGNDLVDTSSANFGHNRIYAGSGNDDLSAGVGDRLMGGDGDDTIDLYEGQGDNRAYGGNGNDTFYLGSGDILMGGDGVDKFYVTTGGDNIITGGAGKDEFWIANAELPAPGNRITDFTQGEDVLGIGGNFGTELDSFEDLKISSSSGNTIIKVNFDGQEKELVTLNGNFTLTANDFVFQV